MPLRDKTLAEMQAGARVLEEKFQGAKLEADYMLAVERTGHRSKALAEWERQGYVTIEIQTRTNPDRVPLLTHTKVVHVRGGPSFTEDPEILAAGGFPSELLIARLALAIQALGVANG